MGIDGRGTGLGAYKTWEETSEAPATCPMCPGAVLLYAPLTRLSIPRTSNSYMGAQDTVLDVGGTDLGVRGK